MKILVLSYEYPPIGGGGGIICKNISENLARMGNEVTVLTTSSPEPGNRSRWIGIPASPPYSVFGNRYSLNGKQFRTIQPEARSQKPEADTLKIRNFKLIRLPSLRKKAFKSNPVEMLSWILTTQKYIRENPGFVDFDLCMAHFVLPGGEVAHWLKKNYGLPYVLISHGHEIPWVHPRQMFLFHLGAYCWIKKVSKHSSLNFVQTKMMKANIDRFLGRKTQAKNIIIPNGVDTSRFYRDYSKRPHQLRILFVGRLVIQKDPMTFMKALKIFSKVTTGFEVRILGDGDLRTRMERFVKKNGLSSHLKFLGKIPEEQMVEEYQSAHLMVAPSLNEGMSIAALEALACGVYLIATRASGFEDMVNEGVNGEFVPFSNPWVLAERMVNYFVNHHNGYESVTPLSGIQSKFFVWEAISQEYHLFMSELPLV